MKYYINGAACISPQSNAITGAEVQETIAIEALYTTTLLAKEPIYNNCISPNDQRRMSKLVKMGVYTALDTLPGGRNEKVDAIITGNGLGGFERAEIFLTSILVNQEKVLSPTPFMQSLHSAVAGQIALELKCYGYTMTYAQRGFSFEQALYDALLFLEETPGAKVLLGGLDEITPNYIQILDDEQLVKKERGEWELLEQSEGQGRVLGEGCAFFLLSTTHTEDTLATITYPALLDKPANSKTITQWIEGYLELHGIKLVDIDLIMAGTTGAIEEDKLFNEALHSIDGQTPVLHFKNFCGEYPTASAFATWLAAMAIKRPTVLGTYYKEEKALGNVLVFNHYNNINYTLQLITKA